MCLNCKHGLVIESRLNFDFNKIRIVQSAQLINLIIVIITIFAKIFES